MADSIINCAEPKQAQVVLLGAPYDVTSSFGKGADRGPQAIRACLDSQIEFYDRLSGLSPAEDLKIAFLEADGIVDKRPEEMVSLLRAKYQEVEGAFVFLLGGEHSVTNAALEHFSLLSSEITVVQIDAHADLRNDDSDYNDKPWGKYAHCSVMRRALEHGYRLVQVGIRAYSAEEMALFSHERIEVFEWGTSTQNVEEILEAVSTRSVYLTVDIDGLDPSFCPATGTPVPGGLSWEFCQKLVKGLCDKKQLVGCDIVEVAPRKTDALTEYTAAQLCYSIIGCVTPRLRA